MKKTMAFSGHLGVGTTDRQLTARAASQLRALGKSAVVAALILGLGLFSIYMPAILIFAVLFFIALIPRSRGWSMTFAAVIAILLFGWMNIDKIPVNDWAWYTAHFRWLQTMALTDYLGNTFYGMKIRVTEPVYHTLSFVVSRLTGASVPTLAAVVTLQIYGCVSLGIARLTLPWVRSNYEACLIVWVPLSIGITFTLTTQLVRQEVASALAFLGFALLWNGNKKLAWLLLLAAVLSHNSVVFPIACVVGAVYLGSKNGFGALPLMASIATGAMLGGAFILSPGGENYYITQRSDGAISTSVFLLDFFITCFAIYSRRWIPELRPLADRILAASLTYFAFVIAVSPAPLLLLRMYFYVDFLRVGLLAMIVLALMRTRLAWLHGFVLFFAAVLYIEARIMSSPFFFRGGVFAHLLRPFAFFQ